MPKKAVLALAACLLAVLLVAPTQAQAAKTYVVIPYTYFGPEAYQHYGKAIRSEMSRKLRMPGDFEPVQEFTLDGQDPTPPQSSADASSLLARLGADYLVFGNVTISGDQAVMNTTVQDATGATFTEDLEAPLDELSLKIGSVAQGLQDQIFPDQIQAGQPGGGPAPGGHNAPSNPDILSANTGQAYTGDPISSINPQFKYEGGAQTEGRWQSQGFRWASRSMTVADGDGDGKNEIFILSDKRIHAMRVEQGKLIEVNAMELSSRGEHIRISALDLDRDGASEIILSSHRDDYPDSAILSWKNGRFSVVAEDLDYYLAVVRMPPNYAPVLIGQDKGERSLLENDDVVELLLQGGELVPGKRVLLPPWGNVFNIVYLPEGDSWKLIVNDEFSRLNVYDQHLELLYQTQETYNSSAIDLPLPAVLMPGLGESNRPDAIMNNDYYVPLRMMVTDLSGSGKWELLVNRDVSVAMTIFYRFRSFIQGELHALFWDGTGLTLAWKTRRIKGTMVDYDIADINNDGKPELVVLLNTYPGALQLEYRKTVIIAYDLNI